MDNVKVYTVNGAASGSSTSLPDWLIRKRAAKGKGKREIREHVEGTIDLIQHFEFPEASNRIRTTRDGHHTMATGTYKPQIHVYDLDQLSIKFERHTDAENVDFIILSDDWTKSLHLQNDRTVELHTQGGFHYRTRIPRFGRTLAYHFPSCDALVAGAGSEVYRLNLAQGRFMAPLVLDPDSASEGVNAIDINPAHQLFAFGLDGRGVVDFWDPRARARVGMLELPGVDVREMEGVSALASRADGLSLAVGTKAGRTLLYDLRAARPFATKDQGYGLPVHCVSWVEGGSRMAGDGLVATADKKVVKIWDRNSPGTNFASVTPSTDINHLHHVPGSGMIMLANEGIQMTSYYIPQLGPAPRWCSFLDNITEEMEEQTVRNVYEDYKFVERSELDRDPRFAEVFEDPDFEVDTTSREFGLLNPSSSATMNSKSGTRLRTAVEEEEEESERASSDGLGSDSEESEAGEMDVDSDSSREGDLNLYNPRARPSKPDHKTQTQTQTKPRISNSNQSAPRPSKHSSGPRLTTSRTRPSPQGTREKSGPSLGRDTYVNALSDGGFEMSFVPSGRADSDEEERKNTRKNRKGGGSGGQVERFGAGMERGGRSEEEVKENERNGRTKRRTGVRSGSKNAFRRG
ncbi:hypothetical protein FRC07_000946 [Ceratobasidium sp. 392]|nr:hypothetical protein FRC07_000946 [Ceratobasidium sp. 392]